MHALACIHIKDMRMHTCTSYTLTYGQINNTMDMSPSPFVVRPPRQSGSMHIGGSADSPWSASAPNRLRVCVYVHVCGGSP